MATTQTAEVERPGEEQTTMRAVQVNHAGGPLELVERPIPEPGPGQVRIKVEACGICHSDAYTKEGTLPVKYPRIPGHEVAGRIDKVGEWARLFKVGDRVGVGWHGGHCFECDQCRRGNFIECFRAQATGVSFDGGYAEYLVVPWDAVAWLPAQLSSVEAAPLLCSGITTFNALRNSGARPGDLVAIQGIGGLGHLAIQFANKMGCRVVAISTSKDKEELAHKLGAHHFIATETGNVTVELLKMGGANVALATAPSGAAMTPLVNGLAPNGKLMIVAGSPDPVAVQPGLLIGKRRVLQGWASGTASDWEDTLNFSVLTGVRAMVEVYPLEQATQAYERMITNQARFKAVLEITPGIGQ